MNRIWLILMTLSLGLLLIAGPENALGGMLNASHEAAQLSFELLAVYAVWLGILRIVEETGLSRVLARLLRPVIRFLFGKETTPETEGYIAMNMSANLLGMGNAATPMGIKAVESLNDKSGIASDAMIMLFVINASGIQLIPTTIIGLRSAAGSASPSDIVLPVIIATFASAFFGIFLVKLIQALSKKRAARSKAGSAGGTRSPYQCRRLRKKGGA